MNEYNSKFISLDYHRLTINGDSLGKRFLKTDGMEIRTTGKRFLQSLEVIPTQVFKTRDRLISQRQLDDLRTLTESFCGDQYGIGGWSIESVSYIEIGVDVNASFNSLLLSAQQIQFGTKQPKVHQNREGTDNAIYWGKAHSDSWSVKLYNKGDHTRLEVMIGRKSPPDLRVNDPYSAQELETTFTNTLSKARPIGARTADPFKNFRAITGTIKNTLMGTNWYTKFHSECQDSL